MSLQLFPAKQPLTSVCVVILGEFIMTQRRNLYLLLIADRFSKMSKTVPMKIKSPVEVAKQFLKPLVFINAPTAERIADNWVCFTSKLFIDVYNIVSIQNTFTTTYHPESNGHIGR